MSLEDFKTGLRTAMCRRAVRCGYMPDQATCERNTDGVRDISYPHWDWREAFEFVVDGRLKFVPAKAAACLDALANTWSCSFKDQPFERDPIAGGQFVPNGTCDSVFVGNKILGDPCIHPRECAASYFCDDTACGTRRCCFGSCRPQSVVDVECRRDTCAATAFCAIPEAGLEVGDCKPLRREGEACNDTSYSCQLHLWCSGPFRNKRCVKPPDQGEDCYNACGLLTNVCDKKTMKCRPRTKVGDPCVVLDDECVAWTSCRDGVCKPRGDLGEVCTTGLSFLSCVCRDGKCAFDGTTPGQWSCR